jgi:hypothetical protein
MKKEIIAILCFASSICNASVQSNPPELWSWFKDLDKSVKACEIQSSYVLQKLKIENQIENEYGIYGSLKGNRIVVKCIEFNEKSKLLVSVAGNDRDSVELIRNLLIKEIN